MHLTPGLQDNGTWVLEIPNPGYKFNNRYLDAVRMAGFTYCWPAYPWGGTLDTYLKRFPQDFLLFPNNDHPNRYTHIVPTHEAACLWMMLKFIHL